MRMPEFNKLKDLTLDETGKQAMAVCLYCKETEIPIEDWNKRCKNCRAKQKEIDEREKQQIEMGIGRRTPAAVITTEDGRQVYVDKFGREVQNPGYDLQNDPRGQKVSGIEKSKKTIIK